ncbi:hypothetical protein SAMN06272735_0062 [Streptomyces sp. TLI_55]|nr:hypothetical protein [Streptomyces sp. TLI_55]SNX55650.1 hypothetical protein SAMN06272735_0062 [Streptomyces sp. TLI_55]
MATTRIRIDAVDLPGLTCTAPANGNVPAYDNSRRRWTASW